MSAADPDDEPTGEIDVCVAIEHLRAAWIKAPAAAKPDLEFLAAHGEETLDVIREHAEEADG